jgi:predicted permease
MTDIGAEVGHALRGLLRRPGFAATALLTLALGIGANTAIISAARGIVFRPLPYPQGERLVHVWAYWPGGAGNISFPDGAAIAERSRTLEATATYQSYGTVALTGRTPAEELHTSFVTPSYFEILGGKAASGRVFTRAEDADGSGAMVVVLSHGAWMRSFGGEAMVGRTIRLNGLPYEVVGIMPEGFADLGAVEGPISDVFLPTATAARLMGQPPRTEAFRLYWGLGRLKPGVGVQAAQDELDAMARQIEKERPQTHRGYGLRVQSLSDRIRGGFVRPALVLMAGSAFVLLIGAANVTNLLLLRLAERRREMSLRAALGASSGRLFRLVFVEACVLAGLGGVLGTLSGVALSRAVSAWVFANVSPLLDVSMDPAALGATLLCSTAAIFLIGAIPACHARRADVSASLSAGSRSDIDGGGGFTRKTLMAAEVAFALVLLAGGGLMARSFDTLTHTPLGFETSRLLTFRMDLVGPRYQEPAARVGLVDRFLEGARGIPGVEAATVWGPSMLGNATWIVNVAPAGGPTDRPDAFTMLFRHSVSPGGLASLGIERIAGRDFSNADTALAPLVGIVSESVAKQLWPGRDPVGQQLVRSTPGLPPITVIGVARDARHRQRYSLQDVANAGFIGGLGPQRDIYLPYAQRSNNGVTFAVRVKNEGPGIATSLQAAAAALDPDLPLSDLRFLDDRIADQERVPRALALLLLGAALLAALLATTGIYGVVSQAVGQRTREIGLRSALGAGGGDIVRLVARQALIPVGAGGAAGLASALVLGRSVDALLFGVKGLDPATFAAALFCLALVAFLAMILPARRALAVDPAVALRAE